MSLKNLTISCFLMILFAIPSWADSGLPLLGEAAAPLLEKEQSIGRGIYRQLVERGLVIDDPLLTDYLGGIGQDLLAGMERRLREYRFFLVSNDSVNAFAAPGGFIGVHLGMIAQLDSEDELAAVLAHEIAHVRLRHGLQMMEKMDEINWLSMLGIVNAVLLASQSPEAGAAMMALTQAGSTQSMINFTRGNEYEADRVGFDLLQSSEYDPRGMVDLMALLQRKERSGELAQIEYLRTHPVSANRIAEIRARLSAGHKPDRPARFEQFRDYLFFLYPMHAAPPRESAFARALGKMREGSYAEAEKQLQALVRQDPDSIWYRTAVAENLARAHHYQAAAAAYRDLLELYPGQRAIRLKLAEVRLQQGRLSAAAALLERLRQEGDASPRLYALLVTLYQRQNRPWRKRLAQADYHWLNGNRELAVKQYRDLLDQGALSLSDQERIRHRLALGKAGRGL